jgi:hypothetical protein
MLRSEIEHKSTLNALDKYKIDNDMLEKIENIEVLRLFIKNQSRRKWQQEHKDYYKQRYNLVKKGEYEVGKVIYDKTPQTTETEIEIKEKFERTPEYIREYNREYYHRKRKKQKMPEQKCCEKCKCELEQALQIVPEERADD